MLLLTFVVGTAAALSLPGERDLSQYSYADYVEEFGKSYGLARQHVFVDNLKSIQAHNRNPSKLWFMTVNEFTDLSNGEFSKIKHGGLPIRDQSVYVGEYKAENVEGLPDSVDWRQTAGIVTGVKNQGSCGSCWAFSTGETLESHFAIATGNQAPILSPQQLVDCVPNPKHCGGTGGCNGNVQTQAFNYTASAGIAADATYPYKQSTGTCDATKSIPCVQNSGYMQLKLNDYASLMNAVATKGPISITLAAGGPAWQKYGGGIVDKCDCDVDHAVQLVGYGAEKGTDYWLIRNSWGIMWGERGYIRLKRFGEGKEPSCVDKSPQHGVGCKGDTSPKTYHGLCGLLSASSYPTGLKKLAECPEAPQPPETCPFKYCHDKTIQIMYCANWCTKWTGEGSSMCGAKSPTDDTVGTCSCLGPGGIGCYGAPSPALEQIVV